jgi:hypothetical protein
MGVYRVRNGGVRVLAYRNDQSEIHKAPYNDLEILEDAADISHSNLAISS